MNVARGRRSKCFILNFGKLLKPLTSGDPAATSTTHVAVAYEKKVETN